jgi:hypothetical protein
VGAGIYYRDGQLGDEQAPVTNDGFLESFRGNDTEFDIPGVGGSEQ